MSPDRHDSLERPQTDRSAAGRLLLEAESMEVGDWTAMKNAMIDEMAGAGGDDGVAVIPLARD